jgi:NADH dehydrogenase
MSTQQVGLGPHKRRPRVVIIGGGFGGLSAARALSRVNVDVTVIDRTNHHLFQPLLYQVASAVLPPSDITRPIRRMLRKQANASVLLGSVVGIDMQRRLVRLADGTQLAYDYLIVSAGLVHDYFGHHEWAHLAPGLKTVADAEEIRRRFLLAFEEAERTEDTRAHAALLTFIIVGGGPTGVELAGILPATARAAMRDEFRRVEVKQTRVILLEGGPRILPAFHPSLSQRAANDLAKLGVEVRTNSMVTRVERDAVWIGETRLETHNVFWAAGMRGSPLGAQLGVPLNQRGQVFVEADLTIPGHPNVYVIGDLAALRWDASRWIPQLAPFANQAGRCVASNIARTERGEPREAFKYLDKGLLATIGRHKAVGEFRGMRFTGYIAWWAWLLIHIRYLAGFRNRLSVMLEWLWAYFTMERGSRLITAPAHDPADATASPHPLSVEHGQPVRGILIRDLQLQAQVAVSFSAADERRSHEGQTDGLQRGTA